jgi:hypothetical protein
MAPLRIGELAKWVPQVALPVKTKMTEAGKSDGCLEGERKGDRMNYGGVSQDEMNHHQA